MKKKVLISILLIFVISILSFFGDNIWERYLPGDEDPYVDSINYFNNDVDLKVLVYGDDIGFHEGMQYEKINVIDQEILNNKNDYVYLLINDLNGNLSLSENEIKSLVSYAEMNTNFNFYYIGTSAFTQFKENVKNCDLDESHMSFGVVSYEGERLQDYGLWKAVDNEHYQNNVALLGECIIDTILRNITSNEV